MFGTSIPVKNCWVRCISSFPLKFVTCLPSPHSFIPPMKCWIKSALQPGQRFMVGRDDQLFERSPLLYLKNKWQSKAWNISGCPAHFWPCLSAIQLTCKDGRNGYCSFWGSWEIHYHGQLFLEVVNGHHFGVGGISSTEKLSNCLHVLLIGQPDLREEHSQQTTSGNIKNTRDQINGKIISIEKTMDLVIRLFTLSLPRVINFKFPLQPHQKYYSTQYEELGFS